METEEKGGRRGRVLISTFRPPSQGGGVERFLYTLSKILKDAGYEVRVFSRNEKSWLEQRIRPYAAWRIGMRMRRDHNMGDIVLCNNYFSWNAPREHSVVVFHGTERGRAEATREVFSRLRNTLVRLVNSRLDKRATSGRVRVAVSNSTKGEIESYYKTTVDHVIPNAVDTKVFAPATAKNGFRRELNLPMDEFLVLFVGIGDSRKGADVLIDSVLPRLKGMQRVVVVGKSEDVPEEAIRLGDVPFEEMHKVYMACDALIMPSYYEGCSLVTIEALSCGIPTLVSPTGIGKDLQTVAVLCDYVVPLDQPEKYVELLLRLQNSDVEWRRVSRASRETAVKEYDLEMFRTRYISLIESIE